MSYSNYEIFIGTMSLFCTIISTASTIITLVLIFDMKRWNAYILLIFNLTSCQFFYDLAFFFLISYQDHTASLFLAFLTTFGGTAVALWTNIISFVLMSIVKNLHSFDVLGYFKIFFVSVMAVSLTLATLNVVYYDTPDTTTLIVSVYYYLRIASIGFNIIVHTVISYKLHRLGFDKVYQQPNPVSVLASRLKYYPIVQVVSRIGAAWYEGAYTYDTSTYNNHMDATQKTSFFFYAVLAPSAGLGYFLIFLWVQPKAVAVLKVRLQRYRVFRYWLGETQQLITMDSALRVGQISSNVSSEGAIESTIQHTSHRRSPSAPSPLDLDRGSSLFTLLDDLDEDQLAEQIDRQFSLASTGSSAQSIDIHSVSVQSALHNNLL